MRFVQKYSELTCNHCGSHQFVVDPNTGEPGTCAVCHKNYVPSNKKEVDAVQASMEKYQKKLEAKRAYVDAPVCQNCGAQTWNLHFFKDDGNPQLAIGHCRACGKNYTGKNTDEEKDKVAKATYGMSGKDYLEMKNAAATGRKVKRQAATETAITGEAVFDKKLAQEKADQAEKETEEALKTPEKMERPEKEDKQKNIETKPEQEEPKKPRRKTTRKKTSKKAASKKAE